MRLSKVLFLVGAVLASSLHANSEESSIQEEKKAYVQQDGIAFDKNKIWVNIGQDWVQTQTLRTDTHGYYLLARDLPIGFWICDYCDFGNTPWGFCCGRCGRSR